MSVADQERQPREKRCQLGLQRIVIGIADVIAIKTHRREAWEGL